MYEWVRPVGAARPAVPTATAPETSAPAPAASDKTDTPLPNPVLASAPTAEPHLRRAPQPVAGSRSHRRRPPQPQRRPAAEETIAITFRDYSWTEIRDRDGRVILSGMNRGGTTQNVSGTPPLDVVIGNASDVRVTYRGNPVDLVPYTRQNVARLRLPMSPQLHVAAQGGASALERPGGHDHAPTFAAPKGALSALRAAGRAIMATTITAVRGMNDVLPGDAALWERFEDAARDVFAQYGYRNMRVPIVETTPLFVRGIGDATDIVEREMYTFEDKLNGESLTLRPEATAGIVRAAIEHSLIYERPQRVWTSGPMFRHERPQRGRYRQFHQLNVEALGLRGPGCRRRADGDAGAAVARARHRRRHAAQDQFDRRSRRAPLASRGSRRVFRGPRGRSSTPTRSAGCTPIRCASSIPRIPTCRR